MVSDRRTPDDTPVPADVDADAERFVADTDDDDGDAGDELTEVLDAPLETPVVDLLEQRREVDIDVEPERH